MTASTVSEVHDMVQAWEEQTFDVKAESKALQFNGARSLTFPQANPLFGAGTRQAGYLNDNAFLQLAERFTVPAGWAFDDTRCPAPLRELVFNWKLQNVEAKQMLLRNRNGQDGDVTTRAVLSDRYQPYDHGALWDAVSAAVATLPEEPKVILRGPVGDDMRGYLLFEGIAFDAQAPRRGTGDGGGSGGLHPAVYFSNSEVGKGRVRVAGGLYRSYCENGMIYGWREDSALAVTHLWSNYNHIALAVHEGIANALTQSEIAAVQMIAAMDQRIEPTSLGGILDQWAERYGLTVKSKDAWKALVTSAPSLFDVVNAATVLAHSTDSAQEVENLERMAGDLLANQSNARP
jgi:hypothetical protein